MKKTIVSVIILIVAIILLIVAGITYSKTQKYIPIVKMNMASSGITDGIIGAQYGAASKDKLGAMPLESIPLNWSKGPKGTVSYAVTIEDPDTIPVMGFEWIHWITANIPENVTSLPANASTTMAKDMVQGITSYANGYPLVLKDIKGFQVPRKDAAHYGGMVPVNFAHKYTMHVYALNTKLNLKTGYTENQLMSDMQGHILGEGTVYGTYNAEIAHI